MLSSSEFLFSYLKGSRTVIIEAIEGTDNLHLHVLDVLSLLSSHGSLHVTLDLPNEGLIFQFLQSHIPEGELLKAHFWKENDGRSSLGTLDMLRRLRELVRTGSLSVSFSGGQCLYAKATTFVQWVHSGGKELLEDFAEKGIVAELVIFKPTQGAAWYCTPYGCGARPLPWYRPAKEAGLLERDDESGGYVLWTEPSETSFPALM